MEALIKQAKSRRANWMNLPKEPGIYVVFWTQADPPTFSDTSGQAKYAEAGSALTLQAKWEGITKEAATDILYFGRTGNSLKARIRQLVRFGIGKAENHKGGEWLWQVEKIGTANILVQGTPKSEVAAFENWLLDRFYKQHKNHPLANRDGPEGEERWSP